MKKTELGYYSVNGISFSTNKVAAILEAQKTGVDIKWHFYDNEFAAADWTTEPELSLDALYKIRAQQIRDAYDYVIVFCSGGADSTNVIRTFMNNNIHVDEVIAMVPESGLDRWDFNDKDFSPENLMSETKFAQYPILHEISVNSPETKITVIDLFKNMLSVDSDEWIYESEGDLVDIVSYGYGKLDSLSYLVDMAERGVKIAAVWGTDKPVINFTDAGNVVTVLADAPIYLPKYPFKNVYPNVDRVLFYYSAALPELMIKQAHVVARELLKPENAWLYQASQDQIRVGQTQPIATSADAIFSNSMSLNSKPAGYYSPKTVYQRGIVPFIYPTTWNDSLFQVYKFDQSQTFLPAYAGWLPAMHSDTRLSQLVKSDFGLFYSNVSKKYLNYSQTGFRMCLKFFPVGRKSNFMK